MKWFPTRLDDAEAILNNAIMHNGVVLLLSSSWNAATAFVLYDISQYATTLELTPVRLPPIEEGFVPNFCDVVWQRFESNKCIVEGFLAAQPTHRRKSLKAQIDNRAKEALDLGLFDAFQLISLSNQATLFLSESIDALFSPQNAKLLSGFEYFLTQSPNTRLVGVCDESLLTLPKFKRQQDGVYRLSNLNNEELVSHALNCICLVSPHLEVTESTLKALLKQCPSAEVFVESVQQMVLHQRTTVK